MSEVTVGCIALVALLVLFFTGLELPFCMILVGFAGFSYLVNIKAATHMMAKDIYDVFVSYGYTVFPLFIFMGQIAFTSGIAKKLYESAYRFVGHIPGGLAVATIGGATAFKALCGSAVATAATFSNLAVPEMERYGYSRTLSTGLVAIVGTLGCLMPPTIFLILYGLLTEQSIGELFLAGIIPGLGIACFFVLTVFGWAKINPKLAPAGERSHVEAEDRHPARSRGSSLCLRPHDRGASRRVLHPDGSGQHRHHGLAPHGHGETAARLSGIRQGDR